MAKRKLRMEVVRRRTGMNGVELAHALGLTRTTVYRWEKTGVPPHRRAAVKELYGKGKRQFLSNSNVTSRTHKPIESGTSDKLALIELISKSDLTNEVKLRTINSLTK